SQMCQMCHTDPLFLMLYNLGPAKSNEFASIRAGLAGRTLNSFSFLFPPGFRCIALLRSGFSLSSATHVAGLILQCFFFAVCWRAMGFLVYGSLAQVLKYILEYVLYCYLLVCYIMDVE